MVEANDTLTVTNGDVTEDCTVLETYTYYGDEVAKVEGETLAGFVEFEPSDLGSQSANSETSHEVPA